MPLRYDDRAIPIPVIFWLTFGWFCCILWDLTMPPCAANTVVVVVVVVVKLLVFLQKWLIVDCCFLSFLVIVVVVVLVVSSHCYGSVATARTKKFSSRSDWLLCFCWRLLLSLEPLASNCQQAKYFFFVSTVHPSP